MIAKFKLTDKVQTGAFDVAIGIITDIYPGEAPLRYQYWVVFPPPIGRKLMPESSLKPASN